MGQNPQTGSSFEIIRPLSYRSSLAVKGLLGVHKNMGFWLIATCLGFVFLHGVWALSFFTVFV